MGILIFNAAGLIITVASFGVAFLLCRASGVDAEGPIMMIAGPLIAAADLAFRARLEPGRRRWFHADSGGMLFFLCAWQFGVFWFVLGAVYALRG
jgi:hypothetical protein